MSQNKKLAEALQASFCGRYGCLSEDSAVSPILRQILLNTENNYNKNPHKRRHSLVIKKFATILYIHAGSMSYELIHRNMPEALPSLRTVQSLVQAEYSHIEEGVFRFEELLQHLAKPPYIVAVAEDATRIVQKVEYDPHTNRCIGFVLPSNKDGLPMVNAYLATSFDAIEQMFCSSKVSRYAYVYVVQAL